MKRRFSEIESTNKQLEQFRRKLEAMKKDIASISAEKSTLECELPSLKGTKVEKEMEISNLKKQLAAAEEKFARVTAEVETKQARFNVVKKEMEEKEQAIEIDSTIYNALNSHRRHLLGELKPAPAGKLVAASITNTNIEIGRIEKDLSSTANAATGGGGTVPSNSTASSGKPVNSNSNNLNMKKKYWNAALLVGVQKVSKKWKGVANTKDEQRPDIFRKDYAALMAEQGKVVKERKIGGKEVDLFNLIREMLLNGGIEAVAESGGDSVKKIFETLGMNGAKFGPSRLKKFYLTELFLYENLLVNGKAVTPEMRKSVLRNAD